MFQASGGVVSSGLNREQRSTHARDEKYVLWITETCFGHIEVGGE